uniref:Uncharacterized protein n=1 Tax=Sphaerodactylus townsendi TaxID=933632 RepID=A0ACB8FLA5_9SAUR
MKNAVIQQSLPFWKGAESRSSPAASPGSGGAFVALPGCPPDGAEECGAEGPSWGLLAPGLALCGALPGPAEWRGALAAGGPAWQAPLYGTGALFALLAALALLGLAAAPCRRPPPPPCLVAPLQLLLAGAGGARAALLLGQAAGWAALLPAPAARLLHELPLPCLAWALGLGALLLRRPPAKRPPTPPLPRPPAAACLLALPLLLLHFALAAAAATLAAAPPRPAPAPAPALLLAARGLFALLAALLSAALLALSCPRLPRRPTAPARRRPPAPPP